MATKSARDELKRITEEQAKLEKQKDKLREQAKQEALAAANAAIEELKALGYSYRIVEGKATGGTRGTVGKRRTGIRDQVLATVKAAGNGGIRPADIRAKLGITDKSGSQSVANALSALKRTNKITDKDGAYVAA